jgi:G3E family GTPase
MPTSNIVVNVITGFLGSGKSTLLNALVSRPELADTAVIVNEFGEVGIDHQLISSAIDQMVLLENGCVCCEVRGDLVDTLELLEMRVSEGLIPSFSRVVIETTGLADPAPSLHTLMIEPRLLKRFHLGRVAVTLDALNGGGSLNDFGEARKQIAVADIALLTKTDLVDKEEVSALEERIFQLNPGVKLFHVTQGDLSEELAKLLVGEDQGDAPSRIHSDILAYLDTNRHQHENHNHHNKNDHFHGGGEHTGGIKTASIVIEEPIEWEDFTSWIDTVTSLRGPDLLRLKGFLNISGRNGPVVIHAVQHVVHPPVQLAEWPDEDHRTRVVCITRNIQPASLINALLAFCKPAAG